MCSSESFLLGPVCCVVLLSLLPLIRVLLREMLLERGAWDLKEERRHFDCC